MEGAALYFATFGLAAVLTWVLVKWLRNSGRLDIPNERSSHRTPTPRGGGLAIVITLLLSHLILAFYLNDIRLLFLIATTCGIAMLGWADDNLKEGLSPAFRFSIQLLFALLAVWLLGAVDYSPFPPPFEGRLGYFAYPLAILWIIAVTNIYNFLDGIDGYAGIQAVIASCFITYVLGSEQDALPLLALAGAASGFLLFNWDKAKIFMGDIGSAAIGFYLACMPLYLANHASIEGGSKNWYLLTVVALWFFICDGVYTIIRRLIKGEKPWEAHRSHLYQRLNIAGWRHSRIVLLILFLYGLLYLSYYAYIDFTTGTKWGIFVLLFIFFVVYLYLTHHVERRSTKAN